jgi:hypothetical protein
MGGFPVIKVRKTEIVIGAGGVGEGARYSGFRERLERGQGECFIYLSN